MLPQRRDVSVVDSSPSPQQQKKTAEQEHDVIPARTSKTSTYFDKEDSPPPFDKTFRSRR